MTEVDYQMALLLQHKLDEESQRPSFNPLDYELACRLQEQFVQEEQVDNPYNNLVYKHSDTSRCLTDPSWEVIDPTPDIHNLFVAFNERFFWNKLLSVCVKWSTKMTRCAGVCMYQTGGLCSIALSEPLLKLRPRKDLVETLLHEMIHAFLFLTKNNRDRDGHGPEFHKHMFRINKEAGTNITVYHDFHDEVNLYMQHWWRCNGPCQNSKPYFGIVRRAVNRKPGPSDRWWIRHQNYCGGTFIKVKEPEKSVKNKPKETKVVKPKNDIRNYIEIPKNNTENKTQSTITSMNSNIVTLANLNKPSISGTNNNNGFGNLKTKTNSNSTIVITKKKSKSEVVEKNNEPKNDYTIVRDYWINKFPVKRDLVLEEPTCSKMVKIESKLIVCPVCDVKLPEINLNDHLDICLNKDNRRECFICGTEFPVNDYDNHLKSCAEHNFSGDLKIENENTKKCLNCCTDLSITDFDKHVKSCSLNINGNFEDECNNKKNEEKVSCLSCGKYVFRIDLNSHLDECLNDSVFRKKTNNEEGKDCDKEFNCPFCFKLFRECQMKEHLDNCLDVDRIFD